MLTGCGSTEASSKQEHQRAAVSVGRRLERETRTKCCIPRNYTGAPVPPVLTLPRARGPLQTGTVTQDFYAPDLKRYFPTVLISGKYGRNETAGLLRPNFGSGAISAVRSPLPNPFETKRNFNAHRGHVRVSDWKLAEGEVLETNRLSGEKRSSWDDCGNPLSSSTTLDCATSRQAETPGEAYF